MEIASSVALGGIAGLSLGSAGIPRSAKMDTSPKEVLSRSLTNALDNTSFRHDLDQADQVAKAMFAAGSSGFSHHGA